MACAVPSKIARNTGSSDNKSSVGELLGISRIEGQDKSSDTSYSYLATKPSRNYWWLPQLMVENRQMKHGGIIR